MLVRDTVILRLCLDAVGETPEQLNLFQAFYRNVSETQRIILGVSAQDEIRIVETVLSSLPELSSAADIKKQIFIPLCMAVESLSLEMIGCILDKMEEAIDRLKIELVSSSQDSRTIAVAKIWIQPGWRSHKEKRCYYCRISYNARIPKRLRYP